MAKYMECLGSTIYKQINNPMKFTGFLWYVTNELIKENASLREANKRLQEEKQHLETVISHYNRNYLQRARLKAGVKIAYKKNVTIEKILELKKKGLTLDEIANTLGVCKTTIWRRLKEFEKTQVTF
jgi:response regulator of citrate/malate metabolism